MPEYPVNGVAGGRLNVRRAHGFRRGHVLPVPLEHESETLGGESPVPEAPTAPADPPNCTRAPSDHLIIPTYNSSLEGARRPEPRLRPLRRDPVREEDRAAVGDMQAIVNAVNAKPGRRPAGRGKSYQMGTTSLGAPFYVSSSGRRQHRQPQCRPQRRRVLARRDRRHTSAAGALAAVDTRPGLRLDHGPRTATSPPAARCHEGALRAGRPHRLR